jgi:hypothetical protein
MVWNEESRLGRATNYTTNETRLQAKRANGTKSECKGGE